MYNTTTGTIVVVGMVLEECAGEGGSEASAEALAA